MNAPAPRSFSKSPRCRLRLIVSWGLLAVAAITNVALCMACLEFYRREQRVRLFPMIPVPAAVARTPQRTQVLFLGDSRMQEWPELPRSRFVTINAGGGNETTSQILLRAAATLDAVLPQQVIVQAGVNDLKAIGALPDMAQDIEARCLANLTTLVELCRQRGARVVLVPILPTAEPSLVRRVVWSPRIDEARRRVNAALRQRFEGAPDVALLDDHLLHPGDADYRDTLHFTATGYRKLEAAALHVLAP